MKRHGSRTVWSVPEITGAVARRLENLPAVWVEAEIQDLSHRRGQVRFRLVGDHSIAGSMNAVVFGRLGFKPQNGSQVQVNGRVEFFARASTVSMRVERLELVGEGLLRARVAELMEALRGEGLLAPERKRPLPLLPRRIGLVTSASGAARHDVERTVTARHPGVGIVLVDTPVQGDAAPAAIVRALRRLDAIADVDVIVLARGGGSLEDLMAFNAESVCRAIAASGTPVVSAVGHESDTTVSDAVADARASTPTGAGEMVVPDARALTERLDAASAAMVRALARARTSGEDRVRGHARGLVAALRAVGGRAEERVDGVRGRLVAALLRRADAAPAELAERAAALDREGAAALDRASAAVERSARVLGVLSPERTVQRGYAIVRTGRGGAVVSSAASVRAGDPLEIQLADGRLPATAGERP